MNEGRLKKLFYRHIRKMLIFSNHQSLGYLSQNLHLFFYKYYYKDFSYTMKLAERICEDNPNLKCDDQNLNSDSIISYKPNCPEYMKNG